MGWIKPENHLTLLSLWEVQIRRVRREEGEGRREICGSDNVLMADLRALQTVHCSPSMGNNCLIFLFRHIGSNHWPVLLFSSIRRSGI
jgi:hypothetical protein